MRIKTNFEMFNDGIMQAVEVKGHVMKRTVAQLHFGNRTVGIKRFYDAKVAGDEIERVIAIVSPINRQNVVIIGDTVYEISQIQQKYDTKPPCYYVSLKHTDIQYKDERDESE